MRRKTVSIRRKSLVDGIPIMFRIEFSRNEINRDIQIVQMIETPNQSGFPRQGIFRSHQRVSRQKQKIDLEFITLALNEFPGGDRRFLDDRQKVRRNLSDTLPRLIEPQLCGMDEAERSLHTRLIRRGGSRRGILWC